MPSESLEDKIRQSGSPAEMLRNAHSGAYVYPFSREYTSWRDEQKAWSTSAVLFDQSYHMTDFYFEGPDVAKLLSDTGVNSFRTFGKNKAKQFVACNYDGYVIGDAILFGLDDERVSLVGRPTVPDWVAFHAETGGYDVTVTRDLRSAANTAGRLTSRYQIQGPNALKIVEKAHGGPVEHIKFFTMGEISIAGCPVRALNHTMTGIPGMEMTGLELMTPAVHGPAVLDALLRAGAEFDLRQGGSLSYATTPLESGWIPSPVPAIYTGDAMKPFREWLDAASFEANAYLGGSFASDDITDYYLTPWDLGYGRVVKFDHDFVGRSALAALADLPHRRKAWLRWHDEDVARVFADSLFGKEPHTRQIDIPHSVYATLQYDTVLSGRRPVGISTWTGYTVNIGSWCSLAMVDEADARDGAEVTVVWGEGGGSFAQAEIRATISTTPLV